MTQIINRHLGIGEQVQPRVRSKFEPDPAAAFLPYYAGEEVDVSFSAADAPPDGPSTMPEPERPYREPAFYPPDSVEPVDPVVPVESIEPGEALKTVETAKRNETLVRAGEDADAAHSPQDFVRREREAREEKSPQPPVEQPGAVMPADPGIPVHIVTIKTHEDSLHRQFPRPPSDVGKPSSQPDIPINTADIAEQAIPGSRPGNTPFQNTRLKAAGITGDGGMLDAPAPSWRAGKQKHLQSRVNAGESRAGAEQVVNVTIGCIEVRAGLPHTTPEQPSRKKKPSGVMSLDKYLSLSKRVHVNREETHEH